jgi:hypothetical protein
VQRVLKAFSAHPQIVVLGDDKAARVPVCAVDGTEVSI